jgi:hypothetical protein
MIFSKTEEITLSHVYLFVCFFQIARKDINSITLPQNEVRNSLKRG